ncbi:unnamed protein product [Paramecium sonneborni]|uniref:MHCK/EF2 kinase domain protein n=1 Tax=Paramecium sonneborni TaxID=65129 RepID=A0A8S1LAY1_9CILI|nr:unnamed protein product [Paramecium sonneborni]
MAQKLLKESINICPENILCTNNECSLIHPRCFAGVCINFLNGKCKNDSCPQNLLHMNKTDLKKELGQSTINGVFMINICPKIDCQNKNQKCYYLHKDWIIKQNICLKYFNDQCEDQCTQKQKHINWEDLQSKVQKEYEFKNLNPESITDIEKKYIGFEQFCLKNFKGTCDSKGKCPKFHIDWEQVSHVSADQFEKKKLAPCTRSSKPQIQRMDSKSFKKLEILFEKSKIEKLHLNIKERNMLDVLFIMDCTGSMQKWIDQAKESISSIIDNFNQAVQSTQIRIAFVGYRDFSDSKPIEYHDFTTDIELITQFISTLKATGGGDEAEDVAGGIEQALKLNFSKHHLSILCTFLISDAPTHGKQYHDIQGDDYKDKIQSESLEKLMRDLDDKKSPNNYFFCCKLNDTTDKMYKIMKQNFKNLEISELNSKDFAQYVSFSMKLSYTKSTIQLHKQIQSKTKRFQASFVQHKALEPVECNSKNDINYFTNFLTQMGKNQVGGDTILEIDLNQKQLNFNEQGKVSFVFEAFDIRNNLKIIIKVPKEIVELSKKGQLDENILKNAQRSSFIRYNQTLVAKQLSAAYRNSTKQNNKAPPIYYVTPIKYTLCNDFFGLMELYAETYIDIEGPWEKITNNTDYIDKEKQSYSAFSHFTYHYTNKSLVITDLQGKQGVLSDPCIHTKMNIEYLQDDLNLGEEGILTFFKNQHSQCNEICEKLYLFRNSDLQCVPMDRTFLQINKPEFQSVFAVCVICGDIFKTTYEDYQKNSDNSDTCLNCMQVNEFTEICECCGNDFKFDLNRVLKQALDLKVCGDCQKKCSHIQCCDCAQLLQKQITFCNQCEKKEQCYYCQSKCTKRNIKQKVYAADGESKYLCEEACNFFENLYCSKCLQTFSYLKWPSLKDYAKGEYLCKQCQKN